MSGKKLLSSLIVLALAIVPLVASLRLVSKPAYAQSTALGATAAKPAYAARPAYALTCPWWIPICNIGRVADLVEKIWEKGKCITDIDCLVRNAVISYMNTAGLIWFGTPFTELTGEDIAAGMNGEWGKGGLAFTTAGMIDGLYMDPPGLRELHLASHLKHELSDNLISGGGVLAQTSGESMLGPIEGTWASIRNLAYGLFFTIMVAIGFLIMFQKQVPPRTVLTITSALPKILIGLVLITFSFAIVALAFDVVGVFGSRIIVSTMVDLPETPASAETPEDIKGGIIGAFLGVEASRFVAEIIYATLQPFLVNENASAAEAFQALSVFALTGLVLCVTMIGILIQLCYRTVKLLIAAAISPLAFLIGTLPGQEEIMEKFALGVIADCAAFPAIAFMFSLTQLYLRQSLAYVPPEIAEVPIIGILATTGALSVTVIITLILLVVTFIVPSKIVGAINPKRR